MFLKKFTKRRLIRESYLFRYFLNRDLGRRNSILASDTRTSLIQLQQLFGKRKE